MRLHIFKAQIDLKFSVAFFHRNQKFLRGYDYFFEAWMGSVLTKLAARKIRAKCSETVHSLYKWVAGVCFFSAKVAGKYTVG